MKFIIVVGAGLHQVSGIAAAKELGLRVVSVDSRPFAPGHLASSVPLVAKPQRLIEFLQFLKGAGILKKIPPIVTFGSEVGVEIIGSMQNPGFLDRTITKSYFRQIQKELNLPSPRSFLTGVGPDSLHNVSFQSEKAIIVKPNKSSGSRGVGLASGPNQLLMRELVSSASRYSRDRRAILEEFVPGDEIGGQAFMRSGQTASIIISDKLRAGWFTVGHTSPSKFASEEILRSIRHQIEAVCDFLVYSDGPVNFDAVVNGSTITLLEIAFRTSGNGLCEVGAARTGFDYESATTLLELEKWHAKSVTGKTRDAKSTAESWKFTSSLLLRGSRNTWVSKRRFVPKVSDRFKIEALRLKTGFVRAWKSAGDEIGYVVLSHNEPLVQLEGEIFGKSIHLLRGSSDA